MPRVHPGHQGKLAYIIGRGGLFKLLTDFAGNLVRRHCQASDIGDEVLYLLFAEHTAPSWHIGGFPQGGAALGDDICDSLVRSAVHCRAVRMISRPDGQQSGSRSVSLVQFPVTWRTIGLVRLSHRKDVFFSPHGFANKYWDQCKQEQ